MNEEIARRLREAAEAHRPDRARMLARVERGMAGPAVRHRARPFARSGTRVALAGLAATGILATGGLAVAAIVATPSPSPTVTTPATPSPAVSSPHPTSARPTPVAPAPATTPGSSRPTPPATSPSPAADESRNGPLWSAGSVDPRSTVYWTQSNLALKTTQPLTSLTVEFRTVQTGGVKNTGTWQTLPSDDFTVTVQEAGGALVYRWVLKPGLTVPAGSHEFAAQFNNGTGVRSAAGDGYRVDAQGSGGSASVRGGFVPTR
ncbi:hypothetical protein BN159_3330 [Streptomyces davaonensis JCM 4913]|uniref:Uncharacterized protein n=1 Tax=Streptomyces davaonensis (strain DSM 101723 / JCM 4913 / KCC S-0913 / 768) TaxID=1214101 RepID=K4R4R7_STRDJ|nr:hypothetical protein [Streptomyces davaonensis]CCK27709.1 hypothetical protein BN159_3330 [Streptomyces davaonensis JCM 4913]